MLMLPCSKANDRHTHIVYKNVGKHRLEEQSNSAVEEFLKETGL